MKLIGFKELNIGESFLFLNKIWVRLEYEDGGLLFGNSVCSFSIEPTCLFVFPLDEGDMRSFLNKEKEENDFLDDDDRELKSLSKILESMARLEGVKDHEWLSESKERLSLVNEMLSFVDNVRDMNEDVLMNHAIEILNEWYKKKKSKK